MELDILAGNEALKRQLSAQESGRGLSHAYLISGPKGSGKRTLARQIGAAMVCTGDGKRPCGTCAGCKKARGGIHPDIMTVGADEKDISVSQARAIRSDAYIRPNEAQRKVYIIENAQNMNTSAQNAILKLLEEGPAYAAFLLLTHNSAGMLSTIRSRCEGLTLSPVTPAQAEEYLTRRFPGRDAAEIRQAAQSCGGLLGRAIETLEGAELSETVQAARTLAAKFAAGDESELARFCVELEKWDRETFGLLLDASVTLLRHALTLQAGMSEGIGPQDMAAARTLAGLPQKTLLSAVAALEELRQGVEFNVGVGHLCGALCAGLAQARNG